MPRDLKPCGTPAAYRRHVRHGEDPCDACREAENTRNRIGDQPRQPAQCGTRGGYNRHLDLGEEPCTWCRTANSREALAARRRRAKRTQDVPHGYSGYMNWDCRCEICSTAHTEAYRAYWVRRKRREAATR